MRSLFALSKRKNAQGITFGLVLGLVMMASSCVFASSQERDIVIDPVTRDTTYGMVESFLSMLEHAAYRADDLCAQERTRCAQLIHEHVRGLQDMPELHDGLFFVDSLVSLPSVAQRGQALQKQMQQIVRAAAAREEALMGYSQAFVEEVLMNVCNVLADAPDRSGWLATRNPESKNRRVSQKAADACTTNCSTGCSTGDCCSTTCENSSEKICEILDCVIIIKSRLERISNTINCIREKVYEIVTKIDRCDNQSIIDRLIIIESLLENAESRCDIEDCCSKVDVIDVNVNILIDKVMKIKNILCFLVNRVGDIQSTLCRIEQNEEKQDVFLCNILSKICTLLCEERRTQGGIRVIINRTKEILSKVCVLESKIDNIKCSGGGDNSCVEALCESGYFADIQATIDSTNSTVNNISADVISLTGDVVLIGGVVNNINNNVSLLIDIDTQTLATTTTILSKVCDVENQIEDIGDALGALGSSVAEIGDTVDAIDSKTDILEGCCSRVDDIENILKNLDSKFDFEFLTANMNNMSIESLVTEVKDCIGCGNQDQVYTQGLSTIDQINNADLSVIGWLRTIMAKSQNLI